MKNIKIFELFSIIILPITTFIIWSIIFYFYSPLVPIKDAYYYKIMAESLFNPSVSAPYCFRILTPLIAYLIPLDTGTSFFYINFTFFIASSILFYYFLKHMNLNSYYSFCGEFIFTFGSITNIYLIHNYIMVDFLNQLFFLIGCYILLVKIPIKKRYQDFIIILILSIGVLNKETILLLIPIYFVMEKGNVLKKLCKTILITIPSLIIFVILRSVIPYSGSYEEIWLSFHLENLLSTVYNIFLSFGIFWILAFFNFECNVKFLRRTYWLIPIFMGQIILASNIYRLIFLSFPIIISLGMIELKKYNDNFNKIPVITAISSQILITIFYILKKYLQFSFLDIIYFPLIGISSAILFSISIYLFLKSRTVNSLTENENKGNLVISSNFLT
ncbi:MAG: hypothetical protein ACTSPY_14565 [Candidatus Helarchaeota archaeon]